MMEEKKKVLVTGAAGFIGSHVAKRMLDLGYDVATIDNLSTGYRSNIPEGVTFYEGDCFDQAIIENLEKTNWSSIIHIAGQSSGEISYDNPVYDLQTNTQSTLMLLKLAQKTGCNSFVYASSMSVYGDRLDSEAKESDQVSPKSFYGVGKLASEHYLRIYTDYNLTCTSLRLCNTYGPGQNMENMRQGMVSIFLSQAINDSHIHVKGDKDRFRDFSYIDDVVHAFERSMEFCDNKYRCLNVTRNIKITVEELVTEIRNLFDEDISVRYEGSTPGDQVGVYGDNTMISKELSWAPSVSLREGLQKMYDWAK